jgi:predicted neuraminidase
MPLPLTTLSETLSRSWLARLACGLVVAAVLLALDMASRPAPLPPAQAVWPVAAAMSPASQLRLVARGAIPMPADTPSAHASALLAMPPDHRAGLLSFWFAGKGESEPDVQIAASQFDRANQQWSPARFVVNRAVMAAQLGFGIRRLGNPVAWLDAQGRVHLFVVATGLGGWAASRVLHLRQTGPTGPTGSAQDLSQLEFEALRVLPLSWLWNTSHLVRTAPLPLADGGMVLPVHFELGMKYPVALRFDASGEFRGMTRMSGRTHVLQPALLNLDSRHWLALMRDQRPEGKITVAQTRDGGASWADLPDLALSNPDASVAALALQSGRLFLTHNTSPHDRTALDLSESADGQAWTLTQPLEQGLAPSEYSYPALAWADESLWVSYTDQRRAIGWQRFVFSQPTR